METLWIRFIESNQNNGEIRAANGEVPADDKYDAVDNFDALMNILAN